ncbi:pectinesterase-like [Senna tora]|uniref:Pectinesterase n=1 Tax=Senna tora TaxID=362788 RepID=A0A834TAM5_9FABA|nr:pectinesterase-like [Senna tora]
MNKVLVPSVALILVVGCAVGAILMVRQKGDDGDSGLSSHNKAVTVICQDSDQQKECQDTVGSIKGDDPKEFIKVTVEKAMGVVIKALNMSDKLAVEHSKGEDEGIKMAVDDCKDLMELCMHQLEASVAMIKDNGIKDIDARIEDLRNWLAMVISFQQSCHDGFETDGEKKVRETLQVDGGLDDVQKMTAVALDVVAKMDQLLSAFNLDLITKPATSDQRMMQEVDQHGHPNWMSESDRKLLAEPAPRPNAVVAQDGSGQFKTISDALKSYPKNHQGRFVIYVKAGIYNEYVTVDKKMINVLMYGDGPTKTIVTGNKHFPTKTMNTATFAAVGDGFIAKLMAFENTAGHEGHQAVALRVQSARAAFYQCAMHGYQDTLYAQGGKHLYRECEISGTVDFIFGSSRCLVQRSKIIVRKPGPNQKNIIAADGTTAKTMGTGIVIQNCDIVSEPGLDKIAFPSYLARPWKELSMAIFMENNIADFINPDGWLPWNGEQNLKTCYFAEFANTGPGAIADRRVKWGRGLLNKQSAARFTAEHLLIQKSEPWLSEWGIPFDPSFTRA